jgi:hypothetical protein
VVICLHPDSKNFSERLQSYPALLSNTTVFYLESDTTGNQKSLAAAAIQQYSTDSPKQPSAASSSSQMHACHIDGEQMTTWLQAVHAAAGDRKLAAPAHFAVLVRQTLSILRSKTEDALRQIDFLQVCCTPASISQSTQGTTPA